MTAQLERTEPISPVLPPDLLERFDRDGFILLKGIYPPEELRPALAEAEERIYGRPFAEVVADARAGREVPPINDGFSGTTEHGRTQFPTGCREIDRLVENPALLEAFAAVLGTEDLRFCNSHLFVRSGPSDARHGREPWEGFHLDHDALSFLPPAAGEAGERVLWVNAWIILNDIVPEGAPLHVLPGSHRTLPPRLAEMVEAGRFTWRMQVEDLREVCDPQELVPVTAQAGDLLLYRSDLLHGAVPFEDRRRQRAVLTMALTRRENESAQRFARPWAYPEREATLRFFAETTPPVRRLFGWPAPGDAYYNEQTLRLLEGWYSGIDLAPYRRPASRRERGKGP